MTSRRPQRRRTAATHRGNSRAPAPRAGGPWLLVSTLLREGLTTLRESAGARAGSTSEMIRAQGERLLRQRKSRAAEELASVGDAIRLAADKLHDRRIDSLAGYVDAAAARVDDLAELIRRRDLVELTRDLEELARRRPVAVVGGLFVAGLAAGRFIRAGRPVTRERSTNHGIK